MREQVRGRHSRKSLAQTRGLLIERCQLLAFAAARAPEVGTPDGFQNGGARTDVAAEHALHFRDREHYSGERVKAERGKGKLVSQSSQYREQ
jgi:SLT domain-containing protein